MSEAAEPEVTARIHADHTSDRRWKFFRDGSVGQFAYCTAHDVGNLLSVITMCLAELRGRQTSGRLEESVSQGIEAAERGMAAARALVRTASDQFELTQIFDPNRCIEDAASVLRVAAGLRVRLELALAPNIWNVVADPDTAVLALLNLTTNARDAMPRGGELHISTANVTLRGEVAGLAGRFVAITARDTGSGMSAAVISRACRPFFTTKPSGQGTGLGLTQARDFVRRAGGAISIESKVGRGSVVTLYLPRATARRTSTLTNRRKKEIRVFAG